MAIYAVTFSISVAVATATYYIIEFPSQLLGKKLISHMGWGAVPRLSTRAT
jgi:peptidoglycan/LPS O-acetylase OafA/YrhL